MAIALNNVQIRHERRVRLIFSTTLAAGAFTSVAFYTVTSVSGEATSPTVIAALTVTGSPEVVELQMGADLVRGQRYTFSAVAVPAADLSTTPDPSEVVAYYGEILPSPGLQSGGVSELDELLYGRDILFDGGDFVEDGQGDLLTISGVVSLEAALRRCATSNGLPWASEYGVHADEFVDVPIEGLLPLRGRAESAMRADDRVARVRVTIESDNEGGTGTVAIDVTPIGAGDALRQIQVAIPLG